MTIVDVKTIYTGGGIYEYIVLLDDGRYAMFDDDLGRQFVPFVDREPTENDWCSDFFDRYDAGYLVGDDADAFMIDALRESTLTPSEVATRMDILVDRVSG